MPCNFLQFGDATFSKNILHFSPKSACKKQLRQAGLNHLYCGMETGSDRILKLINKGFDAETVVKSGCMAKDAGMILSEFILLGIGGRELSEENAVLTAKALNKI